MPPTVSEFKTLRSNLRAAHELVDSGFSTALAAGASTIARYLRHICSKIEVRHLFYVAMTRAKDELNLIVPQRLHTAPASPAGNRHVYAGRTCLIPASICEHFNRMTLPGTAI
jgi:ATP-dependent exoDNAse (exonuclease V) beta subunit